MIRINLISGPRNISTALLYSFAQRPDCTVVDEPLYAHYLRLSGVEHPGREEILASQEQQGEKVVENVILGPYPTPVVFLKNMAHHLQELQPDFLLQMRNLFLIRHPRQIIASYAAVRPVVTLADIGLDRQWALYQWLLEQGRRPVVLDSNDLLADPPARLPRLCAALGLRWEPAMLQWPAGPRPEDGVWAPYWYNNVHRSTGFRKPSGPERPFPEKFQEVLDQAMILYHHLKNFSL